MIVIPFRRRRKIPSWPIVLGALTAAVLAFAAVSAFLNWPARPNQSAALSIEVIDGDTVTLNGQVYRLVGFDTPEKGNLARCEDERPRAHAAANPLRDWIGSGEANLKRVACACKPGQEGTQSCNFGRLCASLTIAGRDVGQILISEGLAHSSCAAPRAARRVGLGAASNTRHVVALIAQFR
jgi:endonuclease YncB( thermonuclease family)